MGAEAALAVLKIQFRIKLRLCSGLGLRLSFGLCSR